MIGTARRRASSEDLLALPEHLLGQIVDGDLVASPRPGIGHARVTTGLVGDLAGPFDRGRDGPGGWWILVEPELHLGEDVLVPDLAGWRRERVPTLPSAPFLEAAPDWICEALSPATASLDRIRKLPIFARAGVSHAWIVDPAARTLEIFRRSGTQWTLIAGGRDDELIRAEPFEAIEITLGAWWLPAADPGPSPSGRP